MSLLKNTLIAVAMLLGSASLYAGSGHLLYLPAEGVLSNFGIPLGIALLILSVVLASTGGPHQDIGATR